MRVREGDRVRLVREGGGEVTVTVQSVGDGYIRSYTSDFYYCKGWHVAEIVATFAQGGYTGGEFAGVVHSAEFNLDIPDRSAVV